MAKRPVKKTAKKPVKKAASASPVRKQYPCTIDGCKKPPAYMRIEKDATADDGRGHYCADHWKKVVEARNKASYETVQRYKENEKKRLAKKVVRKKVKR